MPEQVERLLDELLRNPVGAFVWNETREALAFFSDQGVVIRVNNAFTRYLGRSETELIGQAFEALTDPKDTAAEQAEWAKLASGTAQTFQMSKRWTTKFAAMLPARMRVIKFPAGNGVAFLQFLPIEFYSVQALPPEEYKRVLQMLVGQWILERWKLVIFVLLAVSGVSNVDRLLQWLLK